jgi:hypothetical protein
MVARVGAITSPDDVRRVVSLDAQPVLRNLLITQSYHDLSEVMRARTGDGAINWCTLGTWASKTAGTFIRNDEIPRLIRLALDRGNLLGRVAAALDPLQLLVLIDRIIDDVSGYILEGNKVVYAELAQAFSDFLAELGDDRVADPQRLARFLSRYSDGPPAPDDAVWDAGHRNLIPTIRGGQGELRAMLTAYYQAMFERDAKARAELLLLGNAHGGIHEQTRLQTYIAGSLDAPIADTLLAHVHDHVDETVEHPTLRSTAHHVADQVIPLVGKLVEEIWETFATKTMMTLTLPDGVIHLARPIPVDPDTPLIPPELVTIDNPELRAALVRYDALDVPEVPTLLHRIEQRLLTLLGLSHIESPSLLGVGAVDWVSLDERMRFILTLFRSRADDLHLIDQPFTVAQREAMAAGQIPPGPL